MNRQFSINLHVPKAELSSVETITDNVLGFLRDHGIPDQRLLAELELAATEGINNAIEHGCQAPDASIDVHCQLDPDTITLEITDPSDFPGWVGTPGLPDDPLNEGGRGAFLIAQLVDSVSHESRGGRHTLILKKSTGPAAWSYLPGSHDHELTAMTEEVGASYEMINALIGLGELLAGAGEVDQFLKLALGRVCELTEAGAAYVRMLRHGSLMLEGRIGALLGGIPETIDPTLPCLECRVFATGEEITLTRKPDEGDPLAGAVSAAFVAPILYKGERRGILVLAQSSPDAPFFTAAQLQVARVVGEYLGIVAAINELQQRRENEQRALRELEIAAEIQMSLMPQHFEFTDHLDVFGLCQPALKAGGDYFDLLHLADGSLLVVCADVMGKGVPAALVANLLRTNLRALSWKASDPGALLTEANANLEPDLRRLEMFITAVTVWIAPDASTIREASAGHPSVILRHSSGELEAADEHGMPLGIIGSATYHTSERSFEVGDTLLLFTDGISETQNANGDFFGDGGLQSAISRLQPRSSKAFLGGILEAVDTYSDKAPAMDDRTMVAVIRTS